MDSSESAPFHLIRTSISSICSQLESGNLDENSLDHVSARLDFYREAITRYDGATEPDERICDRLTTILDEAVRHLDMELNLRYPSEAQPSLLLSHLPRKVFTGTKGKPRFLIEKSHLEDYLI